MEIDDYRKTMNYRTIRYAESDENELQAEVDWALGKTMEERLAHYFEMMAAAYALAGVDIHKYQLERSIRYANEP